MPHSEYNTDNQGQPNSKSTLPGAKDSSTSEDLTAPRQGDFTPWSEEQSHSQATSRLGQSRVIKGRMVKIAEPVKITHEISLEPDPEPESVEITPLIEDETIVGLLLKCSCGKTHEVRFDYGEEQ